MANEALRGRAGRVASVAPSRFSADVKGASLWNFVQLECLGCMRSAIRVQSASGQTGLLFFDTGKIIHAQTARAVGELAALEILAWESGTFDPCDAVWPRTPTVTTPAEELLIHASKGNARGDGAVSNLVVFPGRTVAPATALETDEPAASEESAGQPLLEDHHWEMEVTRPAGPTFESPAAVGPARRSTIEEIAMPVAAHIGPDGTVLEAIDDDTADAVAYAGRLSSLIGELLGLDGFRALECSSKDERFIMYVAEDGGLVAGRLPAAVDVGLIRDRLGL